jgi:META domain
MMRFHHPIAGQSLFAFFALATLAMPASLSANAANAFPFDQELVLDAQPMRPAKRMPVLTVSENGRATVDLWCRTVVARVQVEGAAIKIETAPLPESLPQYMSEGQCNEARVAADNDMLAALAQVTEWQKRGSGVELKSAEGASPALLRFRPSSH